MSKTKNTKAAVSRPAVPADSSGSEVAVDIKQQTTEQLWRDAKDRHAGFETARATMRSAIRISNDCALDAGEILDELKRRTERGKWQKAVEANCSVGIREVQRYIALYKNREVLDEFDPEWRDKFTLVEALDAIAFKRSEDSGEEVVAARESRTTTDSKAKKATKRVQATRQPKARVKTTAQIKKTFDPFRVRITAIQHAVDQVKQAKTLDRIEAEAIAVAKKCEELVGHCRLRRAAINGDPIGKIDGTINGRPIQPPTVVLPGKKAGVKRSSRTIDRTAVGGGSKA